MDRPAPDQFGFTLPDARPEAAAEAVLALRRVAVLCQGAVEVLDGAADVAGSWRGDAAEVYGGQRRALIERCLELGQVGAAAAAVLDRWASPAAGDRSAMVRARDRLEVVTRQEEVAAAAGQRYHPALTAEHDAAQAAWTHAKNAYWAGIELVRQQLAGVVQQVRDRPLSLGDHVAGFASRLWNDSVAGPAVLGWSLTGQAFVDRDAWWRTVSGLPSAGSDLATDAVEDPVGFVGEVVDARDWRDGHIGEALGAGTALFLPGPKAMRRLQSLDETIGLVDLARHEGPGLGHPLERHVGVDDLYLRTRLLTPRVGDDGKVLGPPSAASRFDNLLVAEESVTEALQANEKAVRDYARNPGTDGLRLQLDVGRPIGDVMTRDGGSFRITRGSVVVVWLKPAHGRVYVQTSYVATRLKIDDKELKR